MNLRIIFIAIACFLAVASADPQRRKAKKRFLRSPDEAERVSEERARMRFLRSPDEAESERVWGSSSRRRFQRSPDNAERVWDSNTAFIM